MGKHATFDYDVLVIGSGFGGSVSALRLTEKGYRVGVVEAGARFEDSDFSSGTLDIKSYLWAPALGCYGIQRIDAVRDTMIVAGAGVGGGEAARCARARRKRNAGSLIQKRARSVA